MADVTTWEHVRAVLGLEDTEHGKQAWKAAEGAVRRRCVWHQADATVIEAPEELVQAVILRTARYLARRDTPTGVVGVGDFGPVRITSVDRDIEELESPYRVVAFG